MNTMSYKGYNARVEYDDDDGIFVGRLAGIRDSVGFHAETVAELKAAFREAVDDYIETCAKVGKEPQRPFSGHLMVRIDPVVHERAVMAAELSGQSLAKWTETVLLKEAVEITGLTQTDDLMKSAGLATLFQKGEGTQTVLLREALEIARLAIADEVTKSAGLATAVQQGQQPGTAWMVLLKSIKRLELDARAAGRAPTVRHLDGLVMSGAPRTDYEPYSGEVVAHKQRASKPKHRAERHKA